MLEDYSLYALHLAIPPPWGFHLSNPPNIKSLLRQEIKTEIASGIRRRTRGEGGGIGQVTTTTTYPPLHPVRHFSFHGSKVPKSGSGESESDTPSPSKGVGCLS